jgi:MFS family permease
MQALIGGMSILGRVSLGVLTERMGPKVSLIGLLWFQMLTMLWLIVSHSEWMLWVFTTLFGFSYGGVASVFPLMTEELFGLKALGAIFGLILLGATLGGTIGPTLAGFIFDSTQGYSGGFLAGSLSMAVGAMLSLFIPRKD